MLPSFLALSRFKGRQTVGVGSTGGSPVLSRWGVSDTENEAAQEARSVSKLSGIFLSLLLLNAPLESSARLF